MGNMCEHCGCRGVEPIAELMDEHFELLDVSAEIRDHLAVGNRGAAWKTLAQLAHELGHHVTREEAGVFRALKDQGDFAEAVIALEAEHVDFDEALSELGLDDMDLETRVDELLDDLTLHIDKENLGIFPVAVVTLGASGWNTVTTAHERTFRSGKRNTVPETVTGNG
jgi:hemerythrin-like domain-containing protein